VWKRTSASGTGSPVRCEHSYTHLVKTGCERKPGG
jgi:hypothetical protein